MSTAVPVEPEYLVLGKKIQRLRIRAGLNQTNAAALIGHSRMSLTNIEAGKQRILYHDVVRLVHALRRAAGTKTDGNVLPPSEPGVKA